MGHDRRYRPVWPAWVEDPLVTMVVDIHDHSLFCARCYGLHLDVPCTGQLARFHCLFERSQIAQIPLEAWLVAAIRLFYDRELAVSERRVKPANVLHNASLILGKQIIHILPEG